MWTPARYQATTPTWPGISSTCERRRRKRRAAKWVRKRFLTFLKSFSLTRWKALGVLECGRSMPLWMHPTLASQSGIERPHSKEAQARSLVSRSWESFAGLADILVKNLLRKHLDRLEAADGDQPLTLQVDLQILRNAQLRGVTVFWL